MFLPNFLKREPQAAAEFDSDLFPDYVEVKPSTRAKRLALRLDTKKQVFHLVIPRGISLRTAHQFVLKNEEWMQKRLAELPALVTFKDGTKVSLWGDECEVKINYDSSLKRTTIILNQNELLVSTNKEDPHGRIVRFLKKEAKEKLAKLSREKAARIGKTVNSVVARDTKSRWGSCSEDGNLNFSWRLIFAPYLAMDYVVAHEVAHLEHMDHSKRFWALCAELSEDYEEGKGWMRTHAHELMKYQ